MIGGRGIRIVDTRAARTGYIVSGWVTWHNGKKENFWEMRRSDYNPEHVYIESWLSVIAPQEHNGE